MAHQWLRMGGQLHACPYLVHRRERLSDLGPRPLFDARMELLRSEWMAHRDRCKEMWCKWSHFGKNLFL